VRGRWPTGCRAGQGQAEISHTDSREILEELAEIEKFLALHSRYSVLKKDSNANIDD
jgi:hypothetical protein